MTDDQQVLNQLPKEAINTIIIFILIKLETGSLIDSPNLAQTAFKVLSKFTESDLGLYQLKINLKSSGKKVLTCFLEKLMSLFMIRKDNLLPFCTILKSFLNFFTQLILSCEETGFGLRSSEVRDLLKSSDPSSGPDSLDTLFRSCQASSDVQVQEIVTELKSFMELLQKPSSGVTAIQSEPKVSKSETLAVLFANRSVEKRVENSLLLPSEGSGEMVEVDLITLGRCVSGIEFNLSESLKERILVLDPGKKTLKTDGGEKKAATQQQLLIPAKTIATPNRGRGRATGIRYDPFRTRLPNTSRPPSTHVDDFVAMEKDTSGQLKNRRIKDFQAHRTSSAPSPLYPSTSLSLDTRSTIQKGASFTHNRTSPYLSPRPGSSHWSASTSQTPDLMKRGQR